MKNKFKEGDEVVCIHYKSKPVVIVDEIVAWDGGRETEVWVTDYTQGNPPTRWWGPVDWFKKVGK